MTVVRVGAGVVFCVVTTDGRFEASVVLLCALLEGPISKTLLLLELVEEGLTVVATEEVTIGAFVVAFVAGALVASLKIVDASVRFSIFKDVVGTVSVTFSLLGRVVVCTIFSVVGFFVAFDGDGVVLLGTGLPLVGLGFTVDFVAFVTIGLAVVLCAVVNGRSVGFVTLFVAAVVGRCVFCEVT